MDIAAPGGDRSFGQDAAILSTLNSGATVAQSPGYAWYQGTSMATPHVAAAAALYLAYEPDATPAQVEAALKSSSSRFLVNGEFPDHLCTGSKSCGAGALDIAALLEVDTPPSGVVAALAGIYDGSRVGVTFDPPKGAITSYRIAALSSAGEVLGESRTSETSGYVTVANTAHVERVVITASNGVGAGVAESVAISGYVPPAPPTDPATSGPTVPLPVATPTPPASSAEPTAPAVVQSPQRIRAITRTLKRGKSLRIPMTTKAGLPLRVVSKKRSVCNVRERSGRWLVKGKRVGKCKLKLTAPATGEWMRFKARKVVRVK
ncbi:MAG: S8 family serine peptidase [Actinobacteria bacterium]|nr:S8 family serine peptidase [Actinomycetota bacterium]